MEPVVKLVVFVPQEAERRLREALCAAGAGRIGNYDCCVFVTDGVGWFRPLAGARPFLGEVGKVEEVAECRLETVVEVERLPAVLRAMREAHPYEEIAYDLIPLVNHEYDHLVPARRPH